MRTTFAGLVTVALLVGACSATDIGTDETTTTPAPSSTTSTTSSTSTTSPTVENGATSLINGLPVEDETLLQRRVLAVKIDNHPRARPQSGIESSDMVIELMVEGITRFVTVWHESDTDYLGPNRSGRPTEAELLPAFNEPTFTISGAQGWVQIMLRDAGVNLIKELSTGTFRVSGRSAPHNLYVDTFTLRETADERGYADNPPDGPLWQFGELPATASSASSVNIDFSGNTVVWDWDEAQGMWLRTAGGVESTYIDEEGLNEERVAFPVMVALYTEQYSVNGLPSSHTIGEGTAYVFADGRVVEGTWSRDVETDWFTLTDDSGAVIPVPPGKVWVSLVPANRGLTVTP